MIKKKLPPETLKCLLGLYNKIWEERIVPKEWKSATITTLLKVRIYPKDVRSYICKVFERMTNKRLVWYLEKGKK